MLASVCNVAVVDPDPQLRDVTQIVVDDAVSPAEAVAGMVADRERAAVDERDLAGAPTTGTNSAAASRGDVIESVWRHGPAPSRI